MCGIVGYSGDEDASEILVEGLEKLEYRGYDSAGIATVGNPSIKTVKGEGTIGEVFHNEKVADGKTGVGHTRWATHGGVTDRNAHPHTDCEGKIAVVHNGIINNFSELKEELSDHEFESETDTEVIPHLLEEELENKNIREAAEAVMERIEGSYAVVAVTDTGEMVAMKQNSPLVMAERNGEIFFASDVTPLLEHVESAAFLEDGDLVVVEDGEPEVFNSGERVEREMQEIDWDVEEASKKGYEHYMLKEIHEQPKTVKRAVFQDRKDLEKAVSIMEEAEKIYLTGCGTAGIAAKLGAEYFRESGYEIDVELSHELEYRTDEIGEEDLVIAMSQSGETADLLSTLEDVEADVLAIVNVVGSTLDRKSDHSLYINAGPEIGVASTKAFTGKIAVLNMLKYALYGRINEGRNLLLETAETIEEVLEENKEGVEELSDYLVDKDHAYFIGRNKGRLMAEEAALKLKELSYIHAEAFPSGEFKHGTLALVEDGVPVIGFMKQKGYEDIVSNIIEAKSRGADIAGVGREKIEGFHQFIEIPEDENEEILEIVPFQLLAYKTAVKKGNNPDKPRNLAKSVTVK